MKVSLNSFFTYFWLRLIRNILKLERLLFLVSYDIFSSQWVKAVSTLRLLASLWFNEFSDTDLSLLPTHTQSQCSPASWVHFGWKRRATRSGKCMGRDGTRKRRLMTSQLAWENITELTIPVHESLDRGLRITLLVAKNIAPWIFRNLNSFIQIFCVVSFYNLWRGPNRRRPTMHRCQFCRNQ